MQTLTDPGIHFELSEEQKAVRDAARDFAQNVLKPGVIERDREQTFPGRGESNSVNSVSWA
jgi:alkylation response protein AidB-like acyl-CoA dehydrogenase